jgi:hypothetical protein
MFVAFPYSWNFFADSVVMESAFRTKSVSTNPHLYGTCVKKPLSNNGLFRVCSLQRERVFGEPLASNGLPLWLQCSGFQASFHNINMSHLNVNIYGDIKISLLNCS